MHSLDDDKNGLSLDRRVFLLGTAGALALGTTACGGGGGSFSFPVTGTGAQSAGSQQTTTTATDTAGTVTAADPASATPEAQARKFVHPGLLHTEADFERMRQKVAAQAQPWLEGWNALTSNGRSQLGATPRPLATVIRGGDDSNFAQMYIDIARAYQLALRWKVSQDTRYADLAVVFLNAWSSTMTTLTGNSDRFLAAGIYGYQFANAGEIMRSYEGWAASDFARFQNMMLTLFYPLNHSFLLDHNGSEITNYWANWDLCNIASMLAIGVLCDRTDIYDEAMSYFKAGQGNGAGLQAVYHVHPGYLGQWQESGRDQGHCTLGIGLAAAFHEMAWNQGDDTYGYENNRFLAGAEYVAKSNLTDSSTGTFYTVPYFTNVNRQGTQSVLSTAGQGHRRVVWESIYNHYANRLGVATPYSLLQAIQMRPEYDGGNGDQLGFGTLTFTRDPLTAQGKPTGLTARVRGTQVLLSWWGCPDAQSYTVRRASTAGGPYTDIASGITDTLSFTDSTVAAGDVWYYVVVATGASGESAASNEERAAIKAELLLQLKFDESTGTQAVDATGRFAAGELQGDATWTAGRQGNAVALGGTNGCVALPAGAAKSFADFSITAWLYIDTLATWSRVFDFGSGTRRYMMLTVRNGSGVPRFSITTEHGYNEQVIDGAAALPTGRWVHVAVTVSDTLGTLYVDGVEAGSNTQMSLAPIDLGATTQNWLGRSQYASDAYLKGRIDDFRIYGGALGSAEVAALAL
ncbi:LamG-like jellyroll fold domain-containing protein [Variovorax sp. NFACC27]|uniref:LamG-like jellyroll fold domain-containing protein n=1 Tax=unclassified Variovorax TaxID=663243 RepID=UPI000896587F|nr:Alginate lyase [Variovorax sp. NFACC28]SEG48908.1 Alginate lyase [Variovorax sp. NFACC29]SFC22929.1 Alginate lyase [Variovorax sp. NFACC26]SFG63806.1 Alginate lyase [Variovorax sp. NFACC27]